MAGGRWRLLSRLAPPAPPDRNARAENDGTTLLITPEALNDFFGRFNEPHDEGEEILPQQ
ncbi:MAG: hypothetical protein M3R63_20920 [Actinomycetota bacterium]|nr:hypothetical protein [Actinomycetota bacterium]